MSRSVKEHYASLHLCLLEDKRWHVWVLVLWIIKEAFDSVFCSGRILCDNITTSHVSGELVLSTLGLKCTDDFSNGRARKRRSFAAGFPVERTHPEEPPERNCVCIPAQPVPPMIHHAETLQSPKFNLTAATPAPLNGGLVGNFTD